MKGLVIAGIAVLALVPVQGRIGINGTNSAPRGLWLTHDTKEIKRGMIVSVCPPASQALEAMKYMGLIHEGRCPGSGVEPLLKAVGAVPGDIVAITQGCAVTVNGDPIPNTAAIGQIKWNDGTYRVMPGEVWVFSTYVPDSFDSRYFGPVKIENILVEVSPLFVDGNSDDMRRGMKS